MMKEFNAFCEQYKKSLKRRDEESEFYFCLFSLAVFLNKLNK